MEIVDNPKKEKWSQNTEQVEKMATEALEEYSKMKEETESSQFKYQKEHERN